MFSGRWVVFAAAAFLSCSRGAWAGAVHAAPLYPAPAPAWSEALARVPNLDARLHPPIVVQLAGEWGMTPDAFKRIIADEQRFHVDLAMIGAGEDLSRHVEALQQETLALTAKGRTLNENERAALYRVAAHLAEIEENYKSLLIEGKSEIVSDYYERASRRGWEIVQSRQKSRGDSDSVGDAACARLLAEIAALPPPSESARERAAAMRRSQRGWKTTEVEQVLEGMGFRRDGGMRHPKYKFPGIRPVTSSHHRSDDAPWNAVSDAVAAIDKSEELRAAAAGNSSVADVPPARVSLDDLAVLVGR